MGFEGNLQHLPGSTGPVVLVVVVVAAVAVSALVLETAFVGVGV